MGLVILSVFAIAFVACGNSGSGDNTTPPGPTEGPTNGGNGTTPPETQPATAAKYAVGITVVYDSSKPTGFEQSPTPAVNYEGQKPILNGMTVEVRWSDNTRNVYNSTTGYTDLQTDPYFCPDPYLNGSEFYALSSGFYGGTRPTYNQVNSVWTLSSGVGATAPNDGFKPIPFALFHKSNPAVRTTIKIAYIRPILRFSWGGSPNNTKYFEDDVVIDPSGVEVTVLYGGDLSYDGESYIRVPVNGKDGDTTNGFKNFSARTGISATSTTNDISTGYLEPVTKIIKMELANVVFDYGQVGSGTGINLDTNNTPRIQVRLGAESDFGVDKKIASDPYYFKTQNVDVYYIRGLGIENYEKDKLDDYFQYDTEPWYANKTKDEIGDYSGPVQNDYWIDQLFNKAALKLKVYYAGTEETKIIGLDEYQRAAALGVARLVSAPDLTARDVESVTARFGYYTNRNVSNPVFPNQEIGLEIPVFEFDSEIQFVKKEKMPPIPLYFEGYHSSASAPHALLNSHVRAVAETYDLVAVYSDGKTKMINDLLWTGAYNTGGPFELTFWGSNYNFRNMTDENIERELRLTLNLDHASVDRTGGTSYNGLRFFNGSGATVNGKNPQDGYLRTYNAFRNRRADLEEPVEILPYKGY